MMECAIHAAFENRKITFGRVYVSVTTDIFSDAVIDGTVLCKFAPGALCSRAFVGHNMRFCGHLFLKNRAEISGIDGRNMMGANLSFALDKRKHGFLADAASSEMLAL